MSGRTKMVVGLVHGKYVHLPIKMVTKQRHYVDPEGSMWRDALDATGQPILMVNNINTIEERVAKMRDK